MSKATRIMLILLGIVMLLAGIWIGAYLAHEAPAKSGYEAAGFLTGFIICGVGWGITMLGFIGENP